MIYQWGWAVGGWEVGGVTEPQQGFNQAMVEKHSLHMELQSMNEHLKAGGEGGGGWWRDQVCCFSFRDLLAISQVGYLLD